jgi:YfiH family protein
VHALCTSRAGGVSAAPFDSLNLGDHVGDDATAVATNRARLTSALNARPVFLRQVHGTSVVALDAHTADGTQGDACLTQQRGIACTIMVADCLPVLFTNRAGSQVAAAHAGWRGLAGQGGVGVLESTFHAMVQASSKACEAVAADLLVWLGPCIGPSAFEVGPEVRAAFLASDPVSEACFQPKDGSKYLADLPGLARLRLQALGINGIYGNDGSERWCTVTQTSAFFSHRRDAARLGSSGRMAACVWLG